ncbi:fasciclin domain-containing protein [Modestobacter italicus]|uniref:fasciclin domain-containing protein n=1 Tax=Modestobacter italicus (strain DSM 44449 / CECT 9708 / BC 501) TaxID=2732864 RepID=UPI0027DF7950|nr:fasciclin domain-containing protein [Modestobacter italicus]
MKAPRSRPRLLSRPGAARLAPLLAVPLLLGGLGACSSDAEGGDAAAGSSTAAGQASSTAPSSAPAVTGPIGPGCGLFPAEGPASLAALATTPVGTAAGAVPELSTLTSAVLTANLVDVVNTREDVTVLAPTNAAFDALGPEALPALLADVPRLTALLTHHVLPGRLAPDELAGEHTTLAGDRVTVAGPADAPSVSAEQTVAGAAPATVVCGNVPTANATVYVVDQVLAPVG